MSVTTVLTALLALLQSEAVIGSFAAKILVACGESSEAVTILSTVCSLVAQSTTVSTSVKAIAAQIDEWCTGDTSYVPADIIAICEDIEATTKKIDAL